MIEDVTGKPLWRFLDDEFCVPLGLKSTAFQEGQSLSAQPIAGKRLVRGAARRSATRHPGPAGGLGLVSSAADLAALLLPLLTGSEDVLSDAMSREMLSPQPFSDGVIPFMGLGVRLRPTGGRTLAIHGGNWWGFNSFVTLVPNEEAVLIGLSTGNRGPACKRAVQELTEAVAPPVKVAPGWHASPAMDQRLLGTYQPRPGFTTNLMAWSTFGNEVQIARSRRGGLEIRSSVGLFNPPRTITPSPLDGPTTYNFHAWGRQQPLIPFSTNQTQVDGLFLLAPNVILRRVRGGRLSRLVRAAVAPLIRWCVQAATYFDARLHTR